MNVPPDLGKLILSVRSDRANPRPKYQRPKAPSPDPAANRLLATLTDGLVSARPEDRTGLIATLEAQRLPGVVPAVIDAVIAGLLRAQAGARRVALFETLVAFGAGAVAAIVCALHEAKRGRQQATLAGALERIGPTLAAGARTRLALDLHTAIARSSDNEAIAAIARALAAIRIASESAGR